MCVGYGRCGVCVGVCERGRWGNEKRGVILSHICISDDTTNDMAAQRHVVNEDILSSKNRLFRMKLLTLYLLNFRKKQLSSCLSS